ncbi:hypothetical protein [Virgibacillus salexigens]|uniref:Uncharacterized protein n=1 Tax=Virgibacillus massiliensis TaxID=1462526 RepID=A0A024QIB5_9BACI|nr:hypothetical protein [Virgibacillus massiliensis]CDQ41925.1 hypothetical protein BN990_04304 [Virgibacillus massiliensis]
MKDLTISISEEQEKFLKQFASKQYSGADDNLITADPFHAVETKQYKYIPYSSDITEFYEDLPLVFTSDDEYDAWFEDETELIRDWYDSRGEDCPIEIKSFSEVDGEEILTADGQEKLIIDYDDYFEAYDIELRAIAWKDYEWKYVASFFILDEAKRYMKYQSHNLCEPRTYTWHPGYQNQGDFVPFRNLLMKIGTQLNNEEVTNNESSS